MGKKAKKEKERKEGLFGSGFLKTVMGTMFENIENNILLLSEFSIFCVFENKKTVFQNNFQRSQRICQWVELSLNNLELEFCLRYERMETIDFKNRNQTGPKPLFLFFSFLFLNFLDCQTIKGCHPRNGVATNSILFVLI